MFKLEGLPPALESLLSREDRIAPVWIVGGAIRDFLLQRRSQDVDFATSGDALALARMAADQLDAHVYILDGERGAGRVLYQAPDGRKQTFDFAQLRGDTIEADLRDRDLTINAMGVRFSAPDELIDPCGGLQHLRAGVVELCAEDAIRRDPVRALRAIRIATELTFKISPQTLAAIRAKTATELISAERIRDELFNILGLTDPTPAIQILAHLEKLHMLFPKRDKSVVAVDWTYQDRDSIDIALRGLRHIVSILNLFTPEADSESAAQSTLGLLKWKLGRFRFTLDQHLHEESSYNRNRREMLLLTTFLHPLFVVSAFDDSSGRPLETSATDHRQAYEQMGNRLRLSRDEIDWAIHWENGLEFLMQPLESSTSTDLLSHRYYRTSRDAGVGAALSMLAYELARNVEPPVADHWASRLEITRAFFEAWFEKHDVLVEPQPLIDGHEVMEVLEIPPGPEIGRIIEQVREGQVVGDLVSRKQALEFIAQQFGSQLG